MRRSGKAIEVRLWRQRLPVALGAFLLLSLVAPAAAQTNEPWTLDFRYAPPSWQTAICLPDDWQKTLVGKDGSLLYDYPGTYAGFGTRISFGLAGETQWLKQQMASSRVPIVCTTRRCGSVDILLESFAVAPPLASSSPRAGLVLERVDSLLAQTDWAAPPAGSDPAYRNVAIGNRHPVHYRFPATKNALYSVVFGLCEGYHTNAGQRILVLQIEGQAQRTLDLVAEKGRNQPEVFSFPARDQDGDGWIDVAVAAAEGSPDRNTILNVLWVFRGTNTPPQEQLLAGHTAQRPLAHLDCGAEPAPGKPPRHDLTLVHLRNNGASAARIVPTLTIESASPIHLDPAHRRVQIGASTSLMASDLIGAVEQGPGKAVCRLPERVIAPHSEQVVSFVVARGHSAEAVAVDLTRAESLRRKAERYWHAAPLPYDRIQVPDAAVQALLESAIRNIYQAREIKKGLPAFQVGPTCYRGLWMVDGSFLLEAVTYLGRAQETRSGIKYLMSFQRSDGGFLLMDAHWKETGIALWAITRHARLTGDKDWLLGVWPDVERAIAFIRHMRQMPPSDAPNARLIPDGFSDGGLADKVPEYTNIYWTLAGLRAAIEAARWLGQADQAADWQQEYDDFLQTFRRAAARDSRTDSHGNHYLPIRMRRGETTPPQKGQWAFLHAIFPGRVFAADDPLVQGNMAMLKAVENEGLVQDTGWLKNGIWTYFGSFYGHAWLWLGQDDKAARTLYAFGNHASPLLAWREEQMPMGQGDGVVGDMPHNWASAEFIRLVRHALVLERGNELHLLEAMPPTWARPGAVTRLRDIATEFGPVSLEFRVAKDGAEGVLKLSPPRRTPPTRVVLHLDTWSGTKGLLDLPVRGLSTTRIKLR